MLARMRKTSKKRTRRKKKNNDKKNGFCLSCDKRNLVRRV